MRIRTIKPEFWAHPLLGRVDDFTKLLAIGLLNMADDEGFFMADASLIRSSLFPFTEDSVRIHGALSDLSRHGWIAIKKHPEMGSIGQVINFTKHQKINRPTKSKIRGYWDSVSPHGVLSEPSRQEQGTGNREQGEEQTPPASPDEPVIQTRSQDHWRYVRLEPWVSMAKRSGCSVTASNFELWQGAMARSGVTAQEFFKHAESMPADKRWYDKIEASLAAAKPKAVHGPKWLAWANAGCTGPEPEAGE